MTRTGDQRADARRNVAAILDAALARLAANPQATVADIAQAAGVGRVTLYGHFKTRADLVEAVFARVQAESAAILDATDTGGEATAALTRLVAATWRVVHHFHALLAAAQSELPAERIRSHHDVHLRRLDALLARGQKAGAFRSDLPRRWLITTCYSVMHAAAEDCAAGRLREREAARVIAATLLAALTPPAARVPEPDPAELAAGEGRPS